MKKVKLILIVALVTITLYGCSVHQYQMGAGPKTNTSESATQWYILFGLVPLNSVDVAKMVGNTADYKVRTASEPLDVLVNIVTSYVTITSRTVTVTK